MRAQIVPTVRGGWAWIVSVWVAWVLAKAGPENALVAFPRCPGRAFFWYGFGPVDTGGPCHENRGVDGNGTGGVDRGICHRIAGGSPGLAASIVPQHSRMGNTLSE